jgi:hypothetical protein
VKAALVIMTFAFILLSITKDIRTQIQGAQWDDGPKFRRTVVLVVLLRSMGKSGER